MPDSIPELIAKLNKDSRQKRIAVSALIQLGEEAVDPLIAALSTKNLSTETQGVLIKILSKIGDKRAVPILSERLQFKDYWFAASHGLLRMDALAPLYQALASPKIDLRRQAVSVLSHKLVEKDMHLLLSFLDDTDEKVRSSAIFALAQAHPSKAA